MKPGTTIYKNVTIGKGTILEEPVILGKPPRGREEGELSLVIGDNCIIRPFTTIYSGTTVGNHFQTGQGVSIREDNIIGDNVSIGTNSVLEFGNRIANNVRIHTDCFLEWVTIEDDVFIGPHVVFTDDPHPMKCPKFKECVGGATVKRLAKIGANATILPGVTIGENAFVGAGSVVVSDVPQNTVVVGNPARALKRINELSCRKGYFKRAYLWPPYSSDQTL